MLLLFIDYLLTIDISSSSFIFSDMASNVNTYILFSSLITSYIILSLVFFCSSNYSSLLSATLLMILVLINNYELSLIYSLFSSSFFSSYLYILLDLLFLPLR
jgi:hypothetical protein